jgi:hypothetical protein
MNTDELNQYMEDHPGMTLNRLPKDILEAYTHLHLKEFTDTLTKRVEMILAGGGYWNCKAFAALVYVDANGIPDLAIVSDPASVEAAAKAAEAYSEVIWGPQTPEPGGYL